MRRELGSFERALALTAERAMMNAVVVLRLTGGPSLDALGRAFERLQAHHPLLRARIVARGRRRFFECDGPSRTAALLPLERQGEHDWKRVAEEELTHGFDMERGPLVRCAYLRGPGETDRGEIVLTFLHAVMDATFAVEAVDELLTLAAETGPSSREALPAGGSIGAVPDESFPPPWRRGARRRARLALFLARQMGGELLYRWRGGSRRPRPPAAPGNCRLLVMELSREAARGLARACRRQRLTVACALQAAMLQALERRGDRARPTPLRYFTFPDLRPFLDPPPPAALAGSFATTMRFTIRPRGSEFWALARRIQRQTLAAFHGGHKFAASLASPLAMRTVFASPRERMATTALSYTGVNKLERFYGQSELRGLHAFTSNFAQGPEYTAQVRWFRGGLVWDFVYLDGDLDAEAASAIAAEIRSILEAAAAGSSILKGARDAARA